MPRGEVIVSTALWAPPGPGPGPGPDPAARVQQASSSWMEGPITAASAMQVRLLGPVCGLPQSARNLCGITGFYA